MNYLLNKSLRKKLIYVSNISLNTIKGLFFQFIHKITLIAISIANTCVGRILQYPNYNLHYYSDCNTCHNQFSELSN